MHLGFSPSLIQVEVMTRALLDQKPGGSGEWRGRGRWWRGVEGVVEGRGGGGGEWEVEGSGGGGGGEVEVEGSGGVVEGSGEGGGGVALPSSADCTDHLSTFCSS